MKFGDIPVRRAKGALLAHSLALPEKRFPKAHCLSDDDIVLLIQNGIQSVRAARLDSDDLDENRAAQAIALFIHASSIDTKPPTTGRVNFHAASSGLFDADAALIDAINAVDPAITIATLARHTPVEAGQLVATIKIIPMQSQPGRRKRLPDYAHRRKLSGFIPSARKSRTHPVAQARHKDFGSRQDHPCHTSAT